MPTKTGYWIRVKNGKVTDVWDYKPSDDKLASETGWREAVEIMPDLVANREIVTTHQINIDVEPTQIVWSKRELEVEERKDVLRAQAKAAFKAVVDAEVAKETDQYPETQYDAAVVDAARVVFETRMDVIAAAMTHEDIDALGD
jgi:adenosine deaminase